MKNLKTSDSEIKYDSIFIRYQTTQQHHTIKHFVFPKSQFSKLFHVWWRISLDSLLTLDSVILCLLMVPVQTIISKSVKSFYINTLDFRETLVGNWRPWPLWFSRSVFQPAALLLLHISGKLLGQRCIVGGLCFPEDPLGHTRSNQQPGEREQEREPAETSSWRAELETTTELSDSELNTFTCSGGK